MAVAQMTEAEIAKDANSGLAQFQTDYPELMADPVLYNIADNMTEAGFQCTIGCHMFQGRPTSRSSATTTSP